MYTCNIASYIHLQGFQNYYSSILLQISDLYVIPTGFHESLNEKNQMCEPCKFSQIRSYNIYKDVIKIRIASDL